jgi:N-glycosylase/DNA lyase
VNRFRIEVSPDEFDLDLCVGSGQVFRWNALPDGRLIGVDGPNWFAVTPLGPGAYEIASNAPEDAFVRLFRLDESLKSIEREIVRRAPEIRPYLNSLRGLRVLRSHDAHEVLFSFLCTPNNNLVRIKSMVQALGAYGPRLGRVDEVVLTRFPDTETVAGIPETELREKGFGYRARTIPDVARQILAKPPGWLVGLRTATYQEAHAELCSLNGVGPKLADCICLFGLHHTEAAPMDTHLWQACCRLYFPEWQGKPLTDVRYRAAADHLRNKFGPLTGWAHQYLFYDNLLNWRERRARKKTP